MSAAPSPNGYSVTTGVLVDGNLIQWGLVNTTDGGKRVTYNSAIDSHTAWVKELFTWNGTVYHTNIAGNCYKRPPSPGWWPQVTDPRTVVQPPPPPPPPPATGTPKDVVLNFLKSIVGKGSVSGQFLGYPQGNTSMVDAVHNTTGKWVGLFGADYFNPSPIDAQWSAMNPCLINHWKAGGLISLCAHMGSPNGGSSWSLNVNLNDLISATSNQAKTNYYRWLDQTIAGLTDLKNNGVVTIWRPFHEMNGNWFWWGSTGGSDATFKTLWMQQYAYFQAKGLGGHVLWWFSPNAGGNLLARYPGDAYVDLVGIDLYTSNPAGAVTDYNTLVSTGKLVTLGEFGSGGPSSGDPAFAETTLISALKSQMPKCVLFQQWWKGGGFTWEISAAQRASEALSDQWAVNRDRITR